MEKYKISCVNWEQGDLGRELKEREEVGRRAEKNVELNKNNNSKKRRWRFRDGSVL